MSKFHSVQQEIDTTHILKDFCLRLKFTNNGVYITFNKKFYCLPPLPHTHNDPIQNTLRHDLYARSNSFMVWKQILPYLFNLISSLIFILHPQRKDIIPLYHDNEGNIKTIPIKENPYFPRSINFIPH